MKPPLCRLCKAAHWSYQDHQYKENGEPQDPTPPEVTVAAPPHVEGGVTSAPVEEPPPLPIPTPLPDPAPVPSPQVVETATGARRVLSGEEKREQKRVRERERWRRKREALKTKAAAPPGA